MGITLTSYRCVIFPIVRSAYVRTYTDSPDTTWNQALMSVWAILEINIGLICNSLMMLKPFVRHHMPAFASRLFGRSTQSGAGGSDHRSNGNGGNSSDRYGRTAAAAGLHGSSGGRRRTDSYILHSIDKAETSDDYDKMGSIESHRRDGGNICVNSMDEPIGIAHGGGDSSSERRIMHDWS